jgi:hypothetical protein
MIMGMFSFDENPEYAEMLERERRARDIITKLQRENEKLRKENYDLREMVLQLKRRSCVEESISNGWIYG